MNNETKIFLTDNILDEGLGQQIGARNFQSLNEDNDGMVVKCGFGTTINICELIEDDGIELTMVSDDANVPIENGVAYLGAMGDVELWIFPRNGSPADGITIYLEIYAKDGEDLALALGDDDLDKIYLGEGIYPGFTVGRAVTIVGCGLGTIIVPFEEYTRIDNLEIYKRGLAEAIGRFERYEELGDSGIALGACDDALGYGLGNGIGEGIGLGSGLGNGRCNSSPMYCANAYAKGRNTIGKAPTRRIYNGLDCSKIKLDNAIVRVAADNVYLENLTIGAQGNGEDFMIGLAFASRTIRTTLKNVGVAKVAVALPQLAEGAIGIYASDCHNVFVGDAMVDIDRSIGNGVSLGICAVKMAKLDGLMSNARIFLGGNSCYNEVQFATRIIIIEDYVGFEADGSKLKYGDVPEGDLNRVVNAILRDDSNDFENLSLFDPQYPDYLAIYYGAAMNYAILVKRDLLGDWQ